MFLSVSIETSLSRSCFASSCTDLGSGPRVSVVGYVDLSMPVLNSLSSDGQCILFTLPTITDFNLPYSFVVDIFTLLFNAYIMVSTENENRKIH